ncbi:MAG: TatD family hydrolase [Bacteroidales bacterium]
MKDVNKVYINIHGHRHANNIQEWVMMSLRAEDYPPEDMETGCYSVGFHPYSVGKADEQDTLNKVRLATENPRVLAIGEIGLDRSIRASFDEQMRIFQAQVEIAEYTDLPVILHVVGAFGELMEFGKNHKPAVPMIIHGYNGDQRTVEELFREGFLISFGEAIAGENPNVIEALKAVPLEKLLLETDEGDLDIREIYQHAASLKGIPADELRLRIMENARTHIGRFCQD